MLHVKGWEGPQLKPLGWIATVPYRPDTDSPVVPEYLWAMHESCSFVDRVRFWEDDQGSMIRNGIGLMHLATRTCLVFRLLRRVAKRYALDRHTLFLIGVRLKGVKGRYLASEFATDTDRIPRSELDDLEVPGILTVANLEDLPDDGPPVPASVLTILEEVGWKLGRTDLGLGTYIQAINLAAERVEPAVLFPDEEDVPLYTADS